MISILVVGNGAGNLFFIIAKKDLENFLNPLFYCGSGGRIRTTDLRVMRFIWVLMISVTYNDFKGLD